MKNKYTKVKIIINNNLKKAFTLAEVIIVMGIIGIVAEMTIPTLVNNVNEAAYKSAWKKNYSVLSAAAVAIMNENGGTLVNAFGPGEYIDHYQIRDVFFNHLNWARKCTGAETAANRCYPYPTYALTGAEETGWSYLLEGSGTLKDGTSLLFIKDNNACAPIHFCGEINVDVNGLKKPNTHGKDIYTLKVLSNKLVPLGSPLVKDYDYTNPSQFCDPTVAGANGNNCSYEYLVK